MRKLVEFELEDGSNVLFETDVISPIESTGGDHRIAKATDHTLTDKSDQLFDSVTARIRPAAQMVLNALSGLNTPHQIYIEFGLKFSAKTGVIFASVDSDVNFKVRVVWEAPKSQ